MQTNPKTDFCGRLGLSVPLIQAPMAGVSTPEMAAAVSDAGALGSVALGSLSAAGARQALAVTRALTDRPFAANVFTHPAPRRDPAREVAFLRCLAPLFEAAGTKAPAALSEIYRSFNDDDDMLEVLSEARPRAVSLHFGPATASRMAALKSIGCLVMATATSVPEALRLAETGVDAIVVQGYGAGGHSGAFLQEPDPGTAGMAGLVDLVQRAVAAVPVPVVAAGGLMDGDDVRRVLAAGAVAAQLGTAFVASPESLAGPAYRSRLLSGGETRLTRLISGRQARGLVNPLLEALEGLGLNPPDYPLTYAAVKRLVAAAGDPAFSVMWAGEGAGRATPLPAAELVQRIRTGLEQAATEG